MCVCENCSTVKALYLYFPSKYVCLNPAVISLNPVLWMGRANLWRAIKWASTCGEQKASVSRINIQIITSAPALGLPAWHCSCVPASAYLAVLLPLPPSPQPQGLSEQGDASPTTQALSLCLAPARLNFQLLLFQQWSHPLFAAGCFSLWLRPIPFGQPVCFFSSSIKPQLS